MTNPIRHQGLDHIVLRVHDADAMERFYREVLGCHVEKRQPAFGLTQFRAGWSLIDMITLDGELGKRGGAGPGAEGRNMDHFCLRVEPFDSAAICAHLSAHDVPHDIAAARYGAEGTGPSVYLTDPEGNEVELKGPATTPPETGEA